METAKSEKRKNRSLKGLIFSDILLIITVGMLLYPVISDIWNSKHTSQMYADYQNTIDTLEEQDYSQLYEDAAAYNRSLVDKGDIRFHMTEQEENKYRKLLNIPGTDVIAYLDVPKIGVNNMPVYHSTDSAVLQVGGGHYEGSSLPVGGESTHCVLSGHTGMAGLKMFSELKKLQLGDTFQVICLGEVLTYQVDNINRVEPDDISLYAHSVCAQAGQQNGACAYLLCEIYSKKDR